MLEVSYRQILTAKQSHEDADGDDIESEIASEAIHLKGYLAKHLTVVYYLPRQFLDAIEKTFRPKQAKVKLFVLQYLQHV